jgi:hypothetical protein
MRELIETFDRRFLGLYRETRELVAMIPAGRLYWQPRESDALFPVNSCGEYVLRSAAAIESTFGGIMTKLWDDPFEWTLPETISTNELMLEYLQEVESTRVRGFGFFKTDEDLKRMIPAPEKLRTIIEILVDTLSRSEHFFGRACGVFKVFSDAKLPRR